MKDATLLRYIPKKYHKAICDIWKDSDGYWINLNDGWIDSDWGTHVIHAESIAELKDTMKNIEREEA
jgi:hypothetical protein